MTKEKIHTLFVEVLAEQFEIGEDRVNSRAKLVADLDLDSLDRIALGAEIEARSGISLADNDIRDCETVGELIDRLAARMDERAR
jgi:acyl carrier protein